MTRVRPILVTLALYLLWPLYQTIDFLAIQPFATSTDTVNYVASIFSYNWLLLNVLFALKIPVLQRLLPYDFRVRAHIVTTLALTLFVVGHALNYFFVNPKQINVVSWSLTVIFPAMVLISFAWVPFPGFKWLHRALRGSVNRPRSKAYDRLKFVHKVLYIALAGLAYVHIIDAKILGFASPLSSAGFRLLFAGTTVAFLITSLYKMALPTLKVVSVIPGEGITRIVLSGHRRLRYAPGQFAFLRFLHSEIRDEEHPFSFTSVAEDGAVEFAVKNVGDFTERLARLETGTRVKVNGGFGAIRPGDASRPVVLIGTGIGAAPLVSILKALILHPRTAPVVCFVAARSRGELIDPGWWDQLPQILPGLKLRVLLTAEGSPLMSGDMFREELGDPTRYEYLVCSSSRVRKRIVEILAELNVPRRKIHFEAFAFG